MLRSIPLIGRMEHEAFMQAGEYLSKAIELEPDYAAAPCLVCLLAHLLCWAGLGGLPRDHDGTGR